jgi:transposase
VQHARREGHWPVVGTSYCKVLLYVLAVVNVVTGALHTNALENPARAKAATGESKTQWMQEAFAAQLRHVARLYPAARHRRVVLIIDDAPWHRGKPIEKALAEHLHLKLCQLPSYSPQLKLIEQFWKLYRRRATHHHLYESPADLKKSIRANVRYLQTVRGRIRTLIAGCYTQDQSATTGT